MIMRITWGKVRSGTWADYELAYKSNVLASKATIKGLRARWLVQDLDQSDQGFVMSLWDSLEDVGAYEQSGFFQDVIQTALRPFFVGEFRTTHCDVRFAEDMVVDSSAS